MTAQRWGTQQQQQQQQQQQSDVLIGIPKTPLAQYMRDYQAPMTAGHMMASGVVGGAPAGVVTGGMSRRLGASGVGADAGAGGDAAGVAAATSSEPDGANSLLKVFGFRPDQATMVMQWLQQHGQIVRHKKVPGSNWLMVEYSNELEAERAAAETTLVLDDGTMIGVARASAHEWDTAGRALGASVAAASARPVVGALSGSRGTGLGASAASLAAASAASGVNGTLAASSLVDSSVFAAAQEERYDRLMQSRVLMGEQAQKRFVPQDPSLAVNSANVVQPLKRTAWQKFTEYVLGW